ncbi:uncharacterized protein At2g33490 isoform X1 [Cryptomeria japonica]|uniref:uncharacterized protein At2g33490 isoform X1 n=1 Tax=Cryptomeria japonica TaxID=3369 RepID=UPI0025AD6D63|nr:uncharacterized protein At2g33490 isoform X1 [Cryptomeria japonica]
MKSSLMKLRGLSKGKHGAKEKDNYGKERHKQKRPLPQLDELAQACQDIKDMRECYEGLITASALTTNSVFEFSESLQEMGSCLLEKTALNNDEDSGRVLIMLGKVQFELHKLLDRYRTHIYQTITAPSESLINELQNVEELKVQCDAKRQTYEEIRAERAKGKSKTGKGEIFTSEHLQSAKEDYENEVTLLVFRLMSLKQGQSRSLLTQAARHYTAQLHLYRKGLASLEALEPHVKKIAEEQHIEYQLNEPEEDDGEVSFEFYPEYDDESTSSENSMELDRFESSSPRSSLQVEPSQTEAKPEEVEYRLSISRRPVVGSKSAPLAPSMYRKSDNVENIQDTSTITLKNLHTYALPVPVGGRSRNTTGRGSNFAMGSGTTGGTETVGSLWHTSPLSQSKNRNTGSEVALAKNELNLPESAENFRTSHLLGQNGILRRQLLPEEPNTGNPANTLPVPASVERMPMVRFDIPDASDSKRIKRHAFSGPLTAKLTRIPGSGPLTSKHMEPSFKSGPIFHSSKGGTSKISPNVSPPNLSPSHKTTLYELPKPPIDSTKPLKSSNISNITHSAPLMAKKSQENSVIQKPRSTIPKPASPLPPPPPGLATRSLSIPSSGQKGQFLQLPKTTEIPERIQFIEEAPSPPLTPIPFPSTKAKQSSANISGTSRESSEGVLGETVKLHGSYSTPEVEHSQTTKVMTKASKYE